MNQRLLPLAFALSPILAACGSDNGGGPERFDLGPDGREDGSGGPGAGGGCPTAGVSEGSLVFDVPGQERTFTVMNTGRTPLHVWSILVFAESGDLSREFTADPGGLDLNLEVPPLGDLGITVTWTDTDRTAPDAATIHVFTDACDDGELVMDAATAGKDPFDPCQARACTLVADDATPFEGGSCTVGNVIDFDGEPWGGTPVRWVALAGRAEGCRALVTGAEIEGEAPWPGLISVAPRTCPDGPDGECEPAALPFDVPDGGTLFLEVTLNAVPLEKRCIDGTLRVELGRGGDGIDLTVGGDLAGCAPAHVPDEGDACDCVLRGCSQEVCNGVDDDCDDLVDEDIVVTCGEGVCFNDGDCRDGREFCEALDLAQPEEDVPCNGVDDDCDGVVDAFRIFCGTGVCFASGVCIDSEQRCEPLPERGPDACADPTECARWCNGLDDDCDDVADGFATVCGTGECGNAGFCSDGLDDCQPLLPPEAVEATCDGLDNDCDGRIDEGCDDDGDGFCDADMAVADPAPAVCLSGGGDCDDEDDGVSPDADEACDDLDNDCNSETDEGCDDDGDGWCDAGMTLAATGSAACPDSVPAPGGGPGDDCDDDPATGATSYPGASELCDNRDNDCDGTIDDFATACGVGECARTGRCTLGADSCRAGAPTTDHCDDLDNNCDGAIDNGCDVDADDYCALDRFVFCVAGGPPAVCPLTPCGGAGDDCADADPRRNPGQTEICDGVDNDCDRLNDENLHGAPCDGPDADLCAEGVFSCVGGVDGGCNDSSDDSVESCNDEGDGGDYDEDCDGLTDEGCDDDGDGYCDQTMEIGPSSPVTCPSTPPGGFGNDCDDACATCNPGVADERICDDHDDDCDGGTDEGCDNDNDGYCDVAFDMGPSGAVTCIGTRARNAPGDDCQDEDPEIHPNRVERCDNVDQDCDGAEDDGCDDDDDGWCDNAFQMGPAGALTCPSTPGGGAGNDCNDFQANVYPGAPEICDGLQNDCLGAGVDAGCDDDNDDYCDRGMQMGSAGAATCSRTLTRDAPGDDCNDAAPAINPGASDPAAAPTVVGVPEVVDATGTSGVNGSLARLPDGRLAAAYFNSAGGGDLRVAIGSAGAFATELAHAGVGVPTGQRASLAVDTAGNLHVCYQDQAGGDLRYGRRDAGTGAWTLETASAGDQDGTFCAIAVSGGEVHVTFHRALPAFDLMYARRAAAGGWTVETVASDGSTGQHNALAIDATGRLHAVYFRGPGAGQARYARRSAAGVWEVVDEQADGSGGLGAAIALDASGNPRVSYYDGAAAALDLRYARRSAGGVWSRETVDAGGDVGRYTSIAVTGSGAGERVHIAYYDATRTDLRYAWQQAGGAWQTAEIESAGLFGQHAGLVVDATDCATGVTPVTHIVHFDAGAGDLRYARARANVVDENCDCQ